MQRRIRRPGELSNQRVASDLVRYAVMAGNDFRKPPESVLDALVSKGLIQLHERGRSHHVGTANFTCSELVLFACITKVEILAEGPMSRVLILSRQPAVPGYIQIQDGGELAW